MTAKRTSNSITSRKDGQVESEVDDDTYRLRIYVAGQNPKSIDAFANMKKQCEEYILGG